MSDYTPTTEDMQTALGEWQWQRRMYQDSIKTMNGQELLNNYLTEATRQAKAEAWDEAIALAVRTLEMHKDGDMTGHEVTVGGMAGYISTAINPYRKEAQS